jgi:hypothetical protein
MCYSISVLYYLVYNILQKFGSKFLRVKANFNKSIIENGLKPYYSEENSVLVSYVENNLKLYTDNSD